MAKHTPRTIWKPAYGIVTHDFMNATVPDSNFFSIRSVDADASMGLVMKRISVTATLGLISSVEQDNNIFSQGVMGFFKWPADAATPTDATIDLRNRTSIIARTPWALVGVTPQRFKIRMKSARLKLGDELWFFYVKLLEDATTTDVSIAMIEEHWETQA